MLLGEIRQSLEIELAGAKHRDRFDFDETRGVGDPQVRQARRLEVVAHVVRVLGHFLVDDHEPFALLLVGHGRDDRQDLVLVVALDEPLDRFLDVEVRHHLAADLGEAAEPAGDFDEAVLVDLGDVAGDVPAVAHHLGGLLRLVEIALHHVGAGHQQHAGRVDRQLLERFGVDDLGGDAGDRAADGAFLQVDLARLRAARRHVDRHQGRQFGRAVALNRPDAEIGLRTRRTGESAAFRRRRPRFRAA